jgi:hypothetical protein
MAHWGAAISYYHQLWDPPISSVDLPSGSAEIEKAAALAENASDREQSFIHSLSVFYATASRASVRQASLSYTHAMREAANQNPDDAESQIFYALAFLSIASPLDPVHTNQKWAAQMLEPLYEQHPDHPGLAHYLIHAYDHPDLAPLGVKAARAYAKIAPSSPHALHMPSHIFTLLGLWSDSIKSNTAARAAAHRQGDIGEELHAMDYLMYAYLQSGRDSGAEQLLADLRSMPGPPAADYKIANAAAAMPARLAIERGRWADAVSLAPLSGAAPQFVAITAWANAVGAARSGNQDLARQHLQRLQQLLALVKQAGDEYWIAQVEIQEASASGWIALADGRADDAVFLLQTAAALEDRVAKRPITPGPVAPAREQFAELLLELHRPAGALRELEASLKLSPRRRRALAAAAKAAELSGDSAAAKRFTAELNSLR